MEAGNDEYADQLCLYGWLLGEQIGDEEVVCCIDEIVSKYMPEGKPLLRVAQHRARVSKCAPDDGSRPDGRLLGGHYQWLDFPRPEP